MYPVNQTNSNMKDKFQRADSNIIGYVHDNFTNRDYMTLHPESLILELYHIKTGLYI